jgi:ABC-type amino acid transport substrate-binding protein
MTHKMAAVIAIVMMVTNLPASAQQTPSLIDKVIKEGVLRVCVAIASPWMMKDPNGSEFIGFDVDMIKELTKIMEVKYELVANPNFSQLIASLQAGKCDVIMSALTRTTKRAMAVNFSDPYFVLGSVWIVRNEHSELDKLEDLNDPKITIAVEQGSISEQRTRTYMPKSNIKALPGGGDALRLTEVETGRSTAAAIDSLKVPVFKAQLPWSKFIPADAFENPVEPAGLAYAVRHGDIDFVNFLNVFIFNSQGNGTIAALKAKWIDPKYIRVQ